MIEAGNVEVKRDEYGMWMHPAFPWHDIAEDTPVTSYVKEWGYECRFISLDRDAPEAIAERYANSNDPDCSYWNPTAPPGVGWILGAIYETKDGPVACFMRPL